MPSPPWISNVRPVTSACGGAAAGLKTSQSAAEAAVAKQRFDRRADRAAGIEDVVHEDARHALEREVERRRADEGLGVLRRLAAPDVDVVAVEGDVELAEGDLGAADLGDAPAQPLGERHATGVDPDQRHAREVGIALDDLVRDPRQGALDCLAVEKDFG